MNTHSLEYHPSSWRFGKNRVGSRRSRCVPALVVGAGLLALTPFAARSAEAAPAASPTVNLADLTLEQLMEVRIEKVVGASKYEQRVTRAPAAVTIVTRDEIQMFDHRTLADVLRSMRGVYVTYDRNYANFGVRGFARPGDFNTRVLLLVDGHRMNDNLYSSALMGSEEMVDMGAIDRVEFIRGPSSSIYGNSAFFGVINVLTRTGAQIDGLETMAGAGSEASRQARVTYGNKFKNGLDVVLSGSSFETDGQKRLYYPEFDSAANNRGIAVNADDERARKLFGRVAYGDLTLMAGYSRREKHVPTASFGTAFNDGRERTADETVFADLKFQHGFAGGGELAARMFYDRYDYRATYPYNYAAPTAPRFIVLSHDDNEGASAGADLQWTTHVREHDTVVLGAEYRRDLHLRQSNFNDDPKTYNFFTDYKGHSTGVFAQGEFALGHDLLASLGLRYDDFSKFGGTLNPRTGLIYSPDPRTTYKLLYGRAYRAANAFEQYLDSPGFLKSNPKLKPETIETYELVYERFLGRNYRVAVSGYDYDISNLISQQFDPRDGLLVFQNVARVGARGVELELEGRYDHGLLIRSSYAWQRTVDEQSGIELNNSPRHMAKLNAALPLVGDVLHLGVELQYLSSLKTIADSRSAGFLLTNVTLFSQSIAKGFEVCVSVTNLFDRPYSYPGSTGHVQNEIPQDGRGVRVKAGYKF